MLFLLSWVFLFKAWLSFQTAESVLVGLFVSSKTCISFLNHPSRPYMLLKNATGLSWRETQEKQERGKNSSRSCWLSLFCLLLSTPLSVFSLEPAVSRGAWLVTLQHIFHWFGLFSWEEGMSCSLCVGVSAQLLAVVHGMDPIWLVACVRKRDRKKGIESANLWMAEWVGLSKARWHKDRGVAV